MACVRTITIKNKATHQFMNVPCGQCLSCRYTYQQSILFATQLELQNVYKRGLGASFVTFTYSDENNPVSLQKSDLQKFMKRVRRYNDYHKTGIEYKYIACGEYGDSFGRPHYHVVFLGLSDYLADMFARKSWKLGLIDVGSLSNGGLRYITKYCTKQIKGKQAEEMYDSKGLQRPFLLRSKGLGYDYLINNQSNIQDNNYTYKRNGKDTPIPKYYRKLLAGEKKDFSNLDVLQSVNDTAHNLNMNFNEYTKYFAISKEKELYNSALASGQGVTNYFQGISHRVGKYDVDNILDPIPF